MESYATNLALNNLELNVSVKSHYVSLAAAAPGQFRTGMGTSSIEN